MEYESLPEPTKTPITLLLKGLSGAGKTWKAAHFPAPLVLFNFDNNLSGLRKLSPEIREGIRIVNPRKDRFGKQLDGTKVFDNFVRQLEKVVADEDIKTVVIDSLTTLAEVLIDKCVGSSQPSTKVQIQHYGDFSRYLKWLAENLLCAEDLDKNIIWIAHEQIMRDELTQEVIYTLNLVTKIKDNLDLYFSDCWRCITKQRGGEVEYMVRVLPGNNFKAKCSLDLPKEFVWDKEAPNVLKQLPGN
jgi:hypothetical protein